MESRPSFVLRLPPGFRFHPTDEELVVQYLKRKVFSCPLPASIIPDIDLPKFDPWDLPGGCEEERYFFNLREAKYPSGSRSNRAARSGYWKATGKEKQIACSRLGQVVGMKKVLVFYRGKPPSETRTDWVMHEYRLAGVAPTACIFPQRKNSTHSSTLPSGDWVLCRIFKKKRATKMDVDAEDGDEVPIRNSVVSFTDFMGQQYRDRNRSSSSLSESSCVTVLSDGSSNGDETTSSSSLP
ncbi:NAC domain-containing protein [Canna indica]|uniref:NAC domain-containing protein n=1 Tax=Canna indica TaxID=4628 RepID=A0AAQ3QJK1_9LILI|nr:NAC domain-containing protein [Canna indica]